LAEVDRPAARQRRLLDGQSAVAALSVIELGRASLLLHLPHHVMRVRLVQLHAVDLYTSRPALHSISRLSLQTDPRDVPPHAHRAVDRSLR